MAERPQASFAKGAITPSLYGRVDLALYNSALRTLKNMFVRVFGGVSNRAGTKFIATTKFPTQESIVVPFIYSTEQAYLLEFGDGYIIPYANDAKIQTGSTFTITSVGVVGTDYLVSTSGVHGLVVDDVIAVRAVSATGSYNEVNDDFTVNAVPTTTTFKFARVATGIGTYVSGGTVRKCLQLATPYGEADLDEIRFTQSADVLTVMHPDYPQYALARVSASSFTFTAEVYENGPFLDINPDETIAVYASAETGSGVTLTASSSIFNSSHVGALFYMEEKDLQKTKPWEPNKKIEGDPYGIYRRSDGKTYQCKTYRVSSNMGTGTVQPTHSEGTAADGDGGEVSGLGDRIGLSWEYIHSGFGIIRITGYTSGTVATGTVVSRLPSSVVGGTSTAAGPWTMTGDGVDVTLTVTGATSNDEENYDVYIDGILQESTAFSVNATSDVLTFVTAPGNLLAVSARQIDARNLTDIWAFGAWSEDQGYPRTGTYYGDRKVFASTRSKPQRVDMSKIGEYDDFGTSVPLVDDDAIAFDMGGRRINAIRDLVALDQLVALTSSGAWRIGAGQDDALTPTTVGFRPQIYRGAGSLAAEVIGDTALYVSYNGNKIRDLQYQGEFAKFGGEEVSLTASHLLSPANNVKDLGYSEEPHGILWVVRTDGKLLSLTYLREQEVAGWAYHDTEGSFERVAVIPVSGRDVPYFIVNRTVNGVGRRYIEKLSDRDEPDVRDLAFMDSHLTYDGRGDGTQSVQLLSSDYEDGGSVTAVLSAGTREFTAENVGNELWLYGDETLYRGAITSYTSSTIVGLTSINSVPTELRGPATTAWGIAADQFYGLTHIAGSDVAVCMDALGEAETIAVSMNGSVTTTEKGVVVHIGLPYTADMETLEINTFGRGSLFIKSKLVQRVAVYTEASRGFYAGPDSSNLSEYTPRDTDTDNYDTPAAVTGVCEIQLSTTWNDTGRVLIRQPRPLPLSVLAVIPDVDGGE